MSKIPAERRRFWATFTASGLVLGSLASFLKEALYFLCSSLMTSIIRLFGGSYGLTPRRRCQPGSGATRAEPVFPTKREGPARRRRRHAMAAEALAPPDAARVAIRIATRVTTVYTNAPKRLREGHFHRFVYTPASPRSLARSSRGATVYTNAPKRRGEARSSHLCTLL